ncbi:HNH endonuclease signature motif containing protein [Agreia sp. COWG]|uniref:HNH endonuclease signature motif containing protein n=1 Tax=Agreia sp. COWG TaxID=2773266 RepID=UPI0019281B1B|nr:HNH endonuclease signature motif containing protein [Agreia sp. COWG]CAD6009422.1 HNHc domain-containing protein [Agreia sp. COWG]
MAQMFEALAEMTSRVSRLHATTDMAALADDELKTFMRLASSLRQEAERVLAFGSAEIHQRSRREFGGAGLAKTSGHVNPQSLIAALTGSTKADARKIDHLGRSLMQASSSQSPGIDKTGEALPPDPDSGAVVRPWFAVITDRMSDGQISPDRFEALRSGLGESSDTVPADALAAAAERLLGCFHPEDAPEVVFRDARQARAFLDRAGVLEKEIELQAKQEAKIWTDRDGMVHLKASFAPEDGAWFKNTLDLILGPKIGGPRLAHGKAATKAAEIENDPRTTDQIRASVLVSLIRAGSLVDENAILAQKRPTVQIIVTASELTQPNRDGVAFIEGTGIPVSSATIDRLVCDTGYITSILSDNGSPLDLGREARLFSPKQRVVISGIQGGCAAPGCDAPPSFCEIHHIDHWIDGGKTNILDAIMLCRHHHMHLHNRGHRIIRDTGPRYEDNYYWVPAATQDTPHPARVRLRFRGVAHDNAMADEPLRTAPQLVHA